MLLVSLFFFLWVPLQVFGTITLTIRDTPVAEGPAVEVQWTREATDPVFSAVRKVKLDELDRRPLPSTPIPVTNPEALSGSVAVSFNRAGVFRIEALVLSGRSDRAPSSVAFGPDFGVLPPGSSGELQPADSTTNVRSRPTPTSPPSSSPDSPNKPSNSKTLIIAITLGGVFFLFIIVLLLYFLRRRSRPRHYSAPATTPGPTFQLGEGNPVQFPTDAYLYREKYASHGHSTNTMPEWDVEKSSYYPNSERRYEAQSEFVTMADMAPSTRNSATFSSMLRIPSAAQKKFRRLTGGTGRTGVSAHTEVSTIHFNPLTGRQIELEERMMQLQGRVAAIQESGDATERSFLGRLNVQIEQLDQLKSSRWALGLTDEEPSNLRSARGY